MYTALSATSKSLADYLTQKFASDTDLKNFFNPDNSGSMVVTLNTPQEMREKNKQGLSVWLYRIVRDDQNLNNRPERMSRDRIRKTPLPFRLHYLITPIVKFTASPSAETEQKLLGKVLQVLYDHPRLRGADLKSDFTGTPLELTLRLEPLGLEEITRIWDALDSSYQLSVSYEVSVVSIDSEDEPVRIPPVEVALPAYSLIVQDQED